jgi:hypothetical protein
MRNILITTLLVLSNASFLFAAVVSNSNIVLSGGGGISDYALTVYQDEFADDPTTIWFDVSGATLSFVDTNVDEGSDWYSTSLLDEFSRSSILGDSHQVFVRATILGFESNDLTTGFGDFYLGVNTGDIGTPWTDLPPRNLYGWAHLQNIGGNLSMLENAMSYRGTGIVVGTTQIIPEPSSYILIICGLAITVSRRRSRTK